MGSEADTHVTGPVLAVQDPEITPVASMRSSHARTLTESGGGDGSGAPCLWSLTQEEHVQKLKKNCRRAFGHTYSRTEWADIDESPRFVEVVAKIRDDCLLGDSKVGFTDWIIMTGCIPFHSREDFEEISGLPGSACLLHLVVLMRDLEMVQKILETHLSPNELYIDSLVFGRYIEKEWIGYSALELAIVVGVSKIVDALIEKDAKVNMSSKGYLQMAAVYALKEEKENTSNIIQSLVRNGIDINAKDKQGYSAFYLAVAKGNIDIVQLLLDWKDKIHLNEACGGGPPAIQIAHEEGFKDIEIALMECDAVKSYIESAFRDRQAYVDVANAILVGAALIASVTFASWLQPPLNYTTSYHGSSVEYVDVEHNFALGCFWVFNTLSFYFAIGTVVFGAHSVLPRSQLFITENVKKLTQNLLLTSLLLVFSVLFVIVAFGIAGFIVLVPILRYQWYMMAPTIFWGIVCIGSIGYLFKSLWENRPWNIRNRKSNASQSILMEINDYYWFYLNKDRA